MSRARAVLVAFALCWSACIERNEVRAAITYAADLHEDPMSVNLSLGGDLFSCDSLAPDERVNVVLDPDADEAQLQLSGTIGDAKLEWSGPDVHDGVGYDIDIQIGDEGDVTETHCIRPCDLWPDDGWYRHLLRTLH